MTSLHKRLLLGLILSLIGLLIACSPAGEGHPPDAGTDAGADVIADTVTDTGEDAASDATVDATGLVDPANPLLTIRILDVGQGDAAILSTPEGGVFVFDTGRKVSDGERLGALLWGTDPQSMVLAVSHYDSDHMGAIEVLFGGPDGAPGAEGVDDDGNGTVDTTVEPGEYGWPGTDDFIPATVLDRGLTYLPDTTDMEQYAAACEEVRHEAVPGQLVDMGVPGLTVEILAVNGVLLDGTDVNAVYENDRSLAFLVTYHAFTMLFTGDLPAYTEALIAQRLAARGVVLDVLHAGHHGSFTSTDPQTLSLLTPTTAVISVGDSPSCGAGFNAYGHPSQETLDALWSAGVTAVYQTEEGGATMATGVCQPADGEVYPRDYHTMAKHIAGEDLVLTTDGAQYLISFGAETHGHATQNPIPY